jgi:hypothetical protein
VKRTCACGTILSRYNHDDECQPCQERNRLHPVIQPIVETTGPTGNPSGLCKCGCGEKTKIADRTRSRSNHKMGVPVFFIAGHERYSTESGRGIQLDENLVLRMRRDHRDGMTFREIGLKYGKRKATVMDAVNGRTWKHVPMDEAA